MLALIEHEQKLPRIKKIDSSQRYINFVWMKFCIKKVFLMRKTALKRLKKLNNINQLAW